MNWGKIAAGVCAGVALVVLVRADAQVARVKDSTSKIAAWDFTTVSLSDEEEAELLKYLKDAPKGSDKIVLKLSKDPRRIPEQHLPPSVDTSDDILRYYEIDNVNLVDVQNGAPQAGIDGYLGGNQLVFTRPQKGDPRIQQVIAGTVGINVVDAFNINDLKKSSPGITAGASGPLAANPACLLASNNVGQKQALAAFIPKDGQTLAEKNAVEYVSECMEPIASLRTSRLTPPFVLLADPLRVMGVFEYLPPAISAGVPFCSGFFISSTRIVTARHCFYIDSKSGSERIELTKLKAGKVVFRRLSSPYDQLRVKEVASVKRTEYFRGIAGGKAITPQEDFLVLETERPIAWLPQVYFSEEVVVRRPVWLAGPAVVAEVAAVPKAIATVGWGSGMECSVFTADDTCLVHICQAVSSFSGAPLIDPDSTASRIVVIGMHVGPYQRISQQCSLPTAISQAGIAAVKKGNSAISGARLSAGISQYYP